MTHEALICAMLRRFAPAVDCPVVHYAHSLDKANSIAVDCTRRLSTEEGRV
jgi:hypothetical protein